MACPDVLDGIYRTGAYPGDEKYESWHQFQPDSTRCKPKPNYDSLTRLVGYMAHFRQNIEEYHITFRQYREPCIYHLSDTLNIKCSVSCVEPRAQSDQDEGPFFFYCEILSRITNTPLAHPICIKFSPEGADTDVSRLEDIIKLHARGHLFSLMRVGEYFSDPFFITSKSVRDYQSKSYKRIEGTAEVDLYLRELVSNNEEGVSDAFTSSSTECLILLNLPFLNVTSGISLVPNVPFGTQRKIDSIEIIEHRDLSSDKSEIASGKMVRHETFFSGGVQLLKRRSLTRVDLSQYNGKSALTKLKYCVPSVRTVRYLPMQRKLIKDEDENHRLLALSVGKDERLITQSSYEAALGKELAKLDLPTMPSLSGFITLEQVYDSLLGSYLSFQHFSKKKLKLDNGYVSIRIGEEPKVIKAYAGDTIIYPTETGKEVHKPMVFGDTASITNGWIVSLDTPNGVVSRTGRVLRICQLSKTSLSLYNAMICSEEIMACTAGDPQRTVFDRQWCQKYIANAIDSADFVNFAVVHDGLHLLVVLEYEDKLVHVQRSEKESVVQILCQDGSYSEHTRSLRDKVETIIKGRIEGTFTPGEFNKIKQCGNVGSTVAPIGADDNLEIKIITDSVTRRKEDYDFTVKSTGELEIKTDSRHLSTKKYGYKIASTAFGEPCLVKLELLPQSLVATDGVKDKLRTNMAMVVGIFSFVREDGRIKYNKPGLPRAYSLHDRSFLYYIGSVVSVDNFCHNLDRVCVPGIHFFISQSDALEFHYGKEGMPEAPISMEWAMGYSALKNVSNPALAEEKKETPEVMGLPDRAPEALIPSGRTSPMRSETLHEAMPPPAPGESKEEDNPIPIIAISGPQNSPFLG